MASSAESSQRRRHGAQRQPSAHPLPRQNQDGLPKLTHGAKSNYLEWNKLLKPKALLEFGDLGRIFDNFDEDGNLDYWEPPEIDVGGYEAPAQGAYDLHGRVLNEQVSAREKLKAKMVQDRPRLYALILSKLSSESLDAVKGDEDWPAIDQQKDPLSLYLAVQLTHAVASSSRHPFALKNESRAAYHAAQQGAGESIISFKERFTGLLSAYTEFGNQVLEDADVAMDFFRGLEEARYTEFKIDCLNQFARGTMEPFADLNEAYLQASTYLVPNRNPINRRPAAAFAIQADTAWHGQDSSGRGAGRGGGRGAGRGPGRGAGRGAGRGRGPGREANGRGGSGRGGRGTSNSAGAGASSSDWRSSAECYGCGEIGHVLADCPEDSPQPRSSQTIVNTARNRSVHMVQGQVFAFRDRGQGHRRDICDVMLDNQANVSLLHPHLLSDIRDTAITVVVTGATGDSVEYTKSGMLEGFGRVLTTTASEWTVNVICFSDVEDRYRVEYAQGKGFVVHMDNNPLVFQRQDGLYIADMSDWYNVSESAAAACHATRDDTARVNVTTIQQREGMYSTAQVERARQARKFVENAGYPSEAVAVQMVEDGNILNSPLTGRDMRLSFAIYDQPPAVARGKATAKRSLRRVGDPTRLMTTKSQYLVADVMHAGGQHFLMALAMPLNMLISVCVPRETTEEFVKAFEVITRLVQDHGFNVNGITVEPQSAVAAVQGRVPGLNVDVTGAGDHVTELDVRMRRVQELMRCTNSTLPWKLPRDLVRDLVTYATKRLNIRGTKANNSLVAPKVAFTGRKVDYARELSIGFGDYVECTVPPPRTRGKKGVPGTQGKRNDPLISRTHPCIALYPVGNQHDSWCFFDMTTAQRVTRTHWKLMPTTALVIARMNELAGIPLDDQQAGDAMPADGGAAAVAALAIPATDNSGTEAAIAADAHTAQPAYFPADSSPEDSGTVPISSPAVSIAATVSDEECHKMPELVLQDSDSEDEDDEQAAVAGAEDAGVEAANEEQDSASGDENPTVTPLARPDPRRSARIAAGRRCNAVIHTFTLRQGLRDQRQDTVKAVSQELRQLLRDKKAATPVDRRGLSKTQLKRIIRSSIFLKAKYDATGAFDKLKARLVANGAQQDRQLYPDRSSPTAHMQSLLMVLALAARERRSACVIDIGGAYLNAEMTGEEVLMELDPVLSNIATQLCPECEPFLDERGKLVVRLDKALYGCIQSAKLWYDELTKTLRDMGYVHNGTDPCVMTKTGTDGKQITLVIFVDDILALSTDAAAMRSLTDGLISKYKDVKHCTKNDFSYLGMHIVIRPDGTVHLSMEHFVDELLKEVQIVGTRATPATARLFEPGDSPPLETDEAMKFHSRTAKLLYLGTRTRSDLLTAVGYLCTRVTRPTERDRDKLWRVLQYLHKTRHQLLVLDADELKLTVHIDAGFGSHEDGKSHSGVCVMLGKACVMAKSSKQKIMTADSTEAELVALSDKIGLGLHCHEFLEDLGYILDPPVVLQDNASTISLVTVGGGKPRTKHMRVRQNVVLEMHHNGQVRIEHVPTADMVADVLTKPLQGEQLCRLAGVLAGTVHL